ncbi:MAG: Crp/Fnr family transcriptional regulator [Rhodobacter sp.]|jgi:CRP-like cAMP-binding protein|nr:Crp/Fnr family transcriptional regulator [Rhodobacter sp.]
MAGHAFWKSFRMFAPLAPEALDAIAAAAQARHWAPGEALFRRGDPGEWLVALEKGRVRISLLARSGRELVLRQAGPAEMLGELALFDADPRSADATAAEPTQGHILTRADFRAIAARHPALNDAALAHLSAMLRDTTEQLESIALYPLRARVARFFLFALIQLNGDDIPEGAAIRLAVSQGELAAMLGASRPKVNRVLQEFREEGILADDGPGVWRCNATALRAEAAVDA